VTKIRQAELLEGGCLDIEKLLDIADRPTLFSSGAPFWNDPYLSEQLLAAHLDQETDAASRRIPTVQRTVDWIVSQARGRLLPKGSILDLGCGPGLHSQRFANLGLKVVGVDLSQRSLQYARREAQQHGLDICYICCDYTALQVKRQFDAICLIYCDLGALTDQERDQLLQIVQSALVPGGYFFFDVHTKRRRSHTADASWEVSEGGFWHCGPHLLLTKHFDYGDGVFLDQYVVINSDAKATVYRIWERTYNPATATDLLQRNGLQVEGMFGDLQGTPLQQDSECLGVIARKPSG